MLNIKTADVLAHGLKKALEVHKGHELYRKAILPCNEEPCRSCRYYSSCLGGCFARAYMMFHDMPKPDPLCIRVYNYMRKVGLKSHHENA